MRWGRLHLLPPVANIAMNPTLGLQTPAPHFRDAAGRVHLEDAQ